MTAENRDLLWWYCYFLAISTILCVIAKDIRLPWQLDILLIPNKKIKKSVSHGRVKFFVCFWVAMVTKFIDKKVSTLTHH